MHIERMCYSHTTRWALTVMETKWKEVVNRNKKKYVFFFLFKQFSFFGFARLRCSLYSGRGKISLFVYWNIKKPNKTNPHTQKTPPHWTTDARPFKSADQLRPEIILLHQKIFNYIGITTEFIFDSINRIRIYIFSGI